MVGIADTFESEYIPLLKVTQDPERTKIDKLLSLEILCGFTFSIALCRANRER